MKYCQLSGWMLEKMFRKLTKKRSERIPTNFAPSLHVFLYKDTRTEQNYLVRPILPRPQSNRKVIPDDI